VSVRLWASPGSVRLGREGVPLLQVQISPRWCHHRPAPRVLPEHAMNYGIHFRADADGLHNPYAQALHRVAGDDDLADGSLSYARLTCNPLLNESHKTAGLMD